jgi:hypothetical protein
VKFLVDNQLPAALAEFLRKRGLDCQHVLDVDLAQASDADIVFKFRFNEPGHVDGDEHVHVQKIQVRRATGDAIGGSTAADTSTWFPAGAAAAQCVA